MDLKNFLFTLFIFSLTAQATFFDQLQSEGTILTFEEFEQELETFSKKGFFLSLGETHLHKNTSGEIHSSLIKKYFKQVESYRICSEVIDSFWKKDFAQPILLDEKLTKARFYKLSLNSSSMRGCHLNLKQSESLLIYSGLYHQYPFGKHFKELPSRTPVQSLPNKNVAYDVRKLKGVFVSHFELDYLLNLHLKAILLQSLDHHDFLIRIQKFRETLKQLLSKFWQISDKKIGLVFKNSSFLKGKYRNNNHKKYFLITTFKLDERGPKDFIYQWLENLPFQDSLSLFKLLKKSKFRIKSFYTEPKLSGLFPQFTFGNGHEFYGDFSFFQFLDKAQRNYLLFVENKDDIRARLLIPGKGGFKQVENPWDFLFQNERPLVYLN